MADDLPKYESLFGIDKMRKSLENTKEKSPVKATLFCKLFGMLTGSSVSLVCLLIFSALPIAMIVIGSIYLHDCPGQRFIPIWLIMFGCFSLFQTLINTSRTVSSCCIQNTDEEDGDGGRGGKAAQHANNGGGCML